MKQGLVQFALAQIQMPGRPGIELTLAGIDAGCARDEADGGAEIWNEVVADVADMILLVLAIG